jgi:hypothetical protein
MTPTMVSGTAFTVMTRPTASGARPNRRCQNASLITATGGAPARSSESVNNRPAAGAMPSVSK